MAAVVLCTSRSAPLSRAAPWNSAGHNGRAEMNCVMLAHPAAGGRKRQGGSESVAMRTIGGGGGGDDGTALM